MMGFPRSNWVVVRGFMMVRFDSTQFTQTSSRWWFQFVFLKKYIPYLLKENDSPQFDDCAYIFVRWGFFVGISWLKTTKLGNVATRYMAPRA